MLHDGPPYANGAPHLGHAVNKILKDVINRRALLQGHQVRYVPGWDTHGLPIELKAVRNLKEEALTPENVTRVARQCAMDEIQVQMKEFQSWAVMGDWQGRYETCSPEYERSQLLAFRQMVSNGHLHVGVKPVWWSPATKTALADAELEYNESHVSPSLWVAFPLVTTMCDLLKPLIGRVSAVAWTTTPWTLPSNRALAVHEELQYSVVSLLQEEKKKKMFLVASNLVEQFVAIASGGVDGASFEIICSGILGSQLVDSTVEHPIVAGRHSPILAAPFVTTEAGTGVVHLAPGHGQDDYLACVQAEIAPYSPVDAEGRFVADSEMPAGLVGLQVLGEGSAAVEAMLRASGRFVAAASFKHKYPYDWRSKTPVIVRSTRQWFLNSRSLLERAEKALSQVRFVPEIGREKMLRTIRARKEDWCISRQRYWGVPVPAFYHKETDEALMDERTIDALLDRMQATGQGSSCWWSSSVEELLPKGFKAEEWVKGTDTMDVWMDSGLSWAYAKDCGLKVPANWVLEGNDQYRGWFQSSLLTWLAAGNDGAPFEAVAVHGFCLDARGVKMSKSVGNVIPPSAVTHGVDTLPGEPRGFEANGVDVLRMWVASHDWTVDMNVSRDAVDAVAKHYRKVRNTLRWLLGVLEDFDPAKVTPDALPSTYVASHLSWLVHRSHLAVERDYEALNFAGVAQRVAEFISELSSIHVESMKDALYCNESDHVFRRSNQRALLQATQFLVDSLSPILPHTMADLVQHAPAQLGFTMERRNFLASPVAPPQPLEWVALNHLRDETNRLLEAARKEKLIGSPLDASVKIIVPEGSKLPPVFQSLGEELPCFFGAVSSVAVESSRNRPTSKFHALVDLIDGSESIALSVDKLPEHSNKCPRCWVRGAFGEYCPRCQRLEEAAKK